MGIEHVNAPNMDVAQRGESNEQHQNVIKPIVQRNLLRFQPLIKQHHRH
jgi:hypothetical protein